MAYFEDPAQMKVIDFIPVRMAGSRRHAAGRFPSSALGSGESDTTRYARYSVDAPELSRPYATMSICDAQRHLVAAGKLPRSGVDGVWGQQSKSALYEFIKTMPLAAVRAVYTDSQDRGNVPPFGSREDYKQVGSTQIRIPQAYVMAFPNKANVPCGSTRTAAPGGSSPSIEPLPADQPPGTTPPAPGEPATEDKDQGDGAAAKSGLPWGWIIGGSLAAIAVVLVIGSGKRRDDESTGSEV